METKIAVLTGVREYSEGEAVELWFNDKGRIVVRAYNEGGCCATDVDLFDLLSSVGVPENAQRQFEHRTLSVTSRN
jgi:hypothetical protein